MDFISEVNRMWPFVSVATTILSVLAALFTGFCLYHLYQRFVSKQDHEELAAGHAELGERVITLERRMEGVPTSQDMHKLQLSIEEIRGDHKAMRAKLEGMGDAMDGINKSLDMLVQAHIKE